ncbi:MAG: DUF2567 domain-containing protein [Actinomycetota bacterium]|nr:DUF2567 domain-containing protein [Actinomycetota bacterium]
MDTQTGYGDLRAPGRDPVRRLAPLAEARAAVLTILVLAACGVGVGLLWSAVSPRVHVIVTANGPDLEHYGSSEFFAGDGSFVIIGVVAGLVAALAVWSLARRRRGPLQLVALAVGCLACGFVAWQVGRHLGLSHYHDLLKNAEEGRRFTKPVDLRGKVALVAQPFAAVVTYLVLVSWVARPDLGVGQKSVEPQGDLQLGEGDRHGAQSPEHGHLPLQQP